MPEVLIVSDGPWLREEIGSVLMGTDVTVREVTTGDAVVPAVRQKRPDLVIVDSSIGHMGGMAVTLDLRLEASGGRLDSVPVLMLLDRRADVFLAKRSGADGWLVKPLDPMRIRKAVKAVVAGGTYHDDSYKPSPDVASTAPEVAV